MVECTVYELRWKYPIVRSNSRYKTDSLQFRHLIADNLRQTQISPSHIGPGGVIIRISHKRVLQSTREQTFKKGAHNYIEFKGLST